MTRAASKSASHYNKNGGSASRTRMDRETSPSPSIKADIKKAQTAANFNTGDSSFKNINLLSNDQLET